MTSKNGVRKPSRKSKYKYRNDYHWINLKKKVTGKDAVCEICGIPHYEKYKSGKNKGNYKPNVRITFNAHHKNYRNRGHEKKEDILSLCSVCHKLGHMLELASRTRGKVFTKLYSIWCSETVWEYEKDSK